MERAGQHIRGLGEKAKAVKYEEFLANPYDSLKQLSDFCGLKVSSNRITDVAETVNSSRAYAFRHDTELSSFAASKANQLGIYGY